MIDSLQQLKNVTKDLNSLVEAASDDQTSEEQYQKLYIAMSHAKLIYDTLCDFIFDFPKGEFDATMALKDVKDVDIESNFESTNIFEENKTAEAFIGHRFGNLFIKSVKKDFESLEYIAVCDCLHFNRMNVKTFYCYLDDITSGRITSCPECDRHIIIDSSHILSFVQNMSDPDKHIVKNMGSLEDKAIFVLTRYLNAFKLTKYLNMFSKLSGDPEVILDKIIIRDSGIFCSLGMYIKTINNKF